MKKLAKNIRICNRCKKEFVRGGNRKVQHYHCSLACYRADQLGTHHTLEAKLKMSQSHKGHRPRIRNPEEWKRKLSQTLKGRPLSPLHREHLLAANRRHTFPSRKGKIAPPEWRKAISDGLRGKSNPNWQGGITPLNERLRRNYDYRVWKNAVLERDNRTCTLCKITGVKVEADHIKPFSTYPALRYEVSNGRTLCVPCHRKTETWGFRKKSLAQGICRVSITPVAEKE